MIDLVKKFFNQCSQRPEEKKSETIHDIRIATCALFLEMANIDGEFTPSERNDILSFLKKHYELADENIKQIIQAAEEEVKNSVDLWKFTSLINENYSINEKMQIIEMVWKIAYSDGRLDKHEDYLVHKLSELLRLTHKQLIDAKLKVLQEHKKENRNEIK